MPGRGKDLNSKRKASVKLKFDTKRSRSLAKDAASVVRETVAPVKKSKQQCSQDDKFVSDNNVLSHQHGTRFKSKNRSNLVKEIPRKDFHTNNNATIGFEYKKVTKPRSINNQPIKNVVDSEQERSFDDGVEVDVVSEDDFGMGQDMDNAGDSSESDRNDDTHDEHDDQGQEVETILGIPQSARDMEEERMVKNNPYLKNLLEKMLEEKLKQVGLSGKSTAVRGTNAENVPSCSTGQAPTPQGRGRNLSVKVKSPSDTTIYRPALAKINDSRPQYNEAIRLPTRNQQSSEIVDLKSRSKI